MCDADGNFYLSREGQEFSFCSDGYTGSNRNLSMNIRVLFLSVYRHTIKCHRESYTQKCSNRCSNYPVTSDKERNCNFARIGIRIKIEI